LISDSCSITSFTKAADPQLFPDRRRTWRTPDGTTYLERRHHRRTPCIRAIPAGATITQAIANELELALAAVTSRAPP
jgi:hypothetical protein